MSVISAMMVFGYHPSQYFEKTQQTKKLEREDNYGIQICKKRNIQGYFPIFQQYAGFMRIKESASKINADGVSGFHVANIIRGVAEIFFLGTLVLWLVDLIVTIGRYLIRATQPPQGHFENDGQLV